MNSIQYRPEIHFTARKGWINDPNGLVYYKGRYHLFSQHYPDDTHWGPMHWLHAVSDDLLHWEELGIALAPDDLGFIFSGSAVVDTDNTSGFGTEDNPPLVAIFTHHWNEPGNPANCHEQQSIAWSTDGVTFHKYEGNPVIPSDMADFRDPKVFKNPKGGWGMVLAAGDRVMFYASQNLKEWEKTGEYTFMFGYEESYGYLSGTHARDKDAVVASMLFAEMACFYEAKGSSVFDRLMEIFDTFGYYIEKSVSIFYEGLDGMEKMSAIMDKARSTALEKIDEKKVLSTSDLLNQVTVNADGSKEDTHLPKTNAIKWKLDGGDWVCVRPSGTEPKLKIYVATKASSSDKANAIAEKYVAYMKAFLS